LGTETPGWTGPGEKALKKSKKTPRHGGNILMTLENGRKIGDVSGMNQKMSKEGILKKMIKLASSEQRRKGSSMGQT